jgi:hypothetical protein
VKVEIDIIPGSDDNTVRLGRDDFVPVAVIAGESFSPREADIKSVRFLGAAPVVAALIDVNDDDLPDLLLIFRVSDLEYDESRFEACLTGSFLSGEQFTGCDDIHFISDDDDDDDDRFD